MIKKFKLWVWSRLGSNTKVTSLFSSYINLPLILLIGFHIYFFSFHINKVKLNASYWTYWISNHQLHSEQKPYSTFNHQCYRDQIGKFKKGKTSSYEITKSQGRCRSMNRSEVKKAWRCGQYKYPKSKTWWPNEKLNCSQQNNSKQQRCCSQYICSFFLVNRRKPEC
jgi:hypothetical protein